ncbi:hypothetical protein AIOL_000645 [Candidatus Rhodobacter oscarellae]|uniref:Uncharacterized protein n=1 Tax=Candidatus Rhodobacter oscarellae TaxID=1675527 RepID=A0A0J9EFN1_9RHOB|nr:hypothetical protein [Candidatus Rhodobacter lobularis]KMW60489.1 hypothetical protein AIOL_000645 [Candidatus Rhodobacter lobularis]
MIWRAIALICAAGTAAGADPCPISDQSRLWGKFRHLSHLMLAVTYRKECGLADGRDIAAIRSLHEAVGCSAQTELGRYFAYRVTAPLTEDSGHPGVAILRAKAPTAFYQFCQMAEFLPWPEGSAYFLMARPEAAPAARLAEYQAFWAHLDAMQAELTRALTELPE